MTTLTITYTLDSLVKKTQSYKFATMFAANAYLKQHEDWEGGEWDKRHINFRTQN